MIRTIIAVFSIVFLISCSQKATTKNDTENIYAQFMVTSGDGAHDVMGCVATFMQEDEDGEKVGLGKGVQVLLDSTLLDFDTAAYPSYIAERDTSEFNGLHTWAIRFPDGKQQLYNFICKPFKITSEIPEIVGTSDIVVNCNALQNTDHVTLFLSGDYSDTSENMLEIVPEEGRFTIPAAFWKNVDPISLEMSFNISITQRLNIDPILSKGGEIESAKITKRYPIKVVH